MVRLALLLTSRVFKALRLEMSNDVNLLLLQLIEVSAEQSPILSVVRALLLQLTQVSEGLEAMSSFFKALRPVMVNDVNSLASQLSSCRPLGSEPSEVNSL